MNARPLLPIAIAVALILATATAASHAGRNTEAARGDRAVAACVL
ncbi:MAG: hypothetical protein ACM3X5_03600 [Bacillota bacterium]